MRESDLYVPVRDWLNERGWEVHVELFDADIVAVKDDLLMAVELKPCLSRELIVQLSQRAQWADFVVGAVGTRPRFTGECTHYGFGLLVVSDGRARQKHKPRPQPWHWHKKRAYRMKKLTGREPAMPHEVAGLPSCRELSAQREMRKDHP